MQSAWNSTPPPVAAPTHRPQQLERKYTVVPLTLGLIGMLIPPLGLALVPVCCLLVIAGRKRIAQGKAATNSILDKASLVCWLIIPVNLLIAFVVFTEYNDARNSKLHSESTHRARLLESAIEKFNSRERRYPRTLEELKSAEPSIELNDAWEDPFVYALGETLTLPRNTTYTITSFGADGRPGGNGPNEDIVRGTGAPPTHRGIWFD